MEETTGLMTGNFLSHNGKDHLVYGYYLPKGPLKGIVQIAHDMGQSFAGYAELARFLCKNGFAVYGHDHLGHGNSVGSERDLGYFGENGPDALIQDLYGMTRCIRQDHPKAPLFLLGEGLGAAITLTYLSRHSQQADGAILLGTPVGSAAMDGLSLLAGRLSKRKGRRYRSSGMEKTILRSYNKRIANPASQNAWLSRDEEAVARYEAEGANGFRLTVSGIHDICSLIRRGTGNTWPEGIRADLPLLFLSGDADPMGGYGRVMEEMAEDLREYPMADVTTRLYRGARHALLMETNRQEVQNDILTWLDGRTAPTPKEDA